MTTAICSRPDKTLDLDAIANSCHSPHFPLQKNCCPLYKTNFKIRYPDIFSCSLSWYIFFFHCLPSFTHNYEGRHEEASLPIASSRCRSNLSDWRSESEEIKSPVVKIPPLSVFEDDDLFFWDFFFILWFIQTDWLSFLFLA